jgi:HlyD family secretion protein
MNLLKSPSKDMATCSKIPWFPQQTMMKYLPNIKAQAQYIAVQAELDEAKKGARIEQQTMARGQKERAIGALQEAETADQERYIVAPQDMSIETITLNLGELALAGYTLFKGYITSSIYFRLQSRKTNWIKDRK